MGDDGTSDKMKGKAKEMTGKVTGNKRKQAEGRSDQLKGDAKNAAGDIRDKGDDAMEPLKRDDKS